MTQGNSDHHSHAARGICGGCFQSSLPEMGEASAKTPVSRRSFTAGGLAAVGLASLTACSVNPATGRYTVGSIEDDVSTGQQQHPQILQAFGGAYKDPMLSRYVSQIGQDLVRHTEYPNLRFTFTVLNTPTVNAFAIPGGYVYLTRGLLALASNEAEMAGVIGHEIGHVIARHGAERQTQGLLTQIGAAAVAVATGSPDLANAANVGGQAYLQSYSRDQELEADTLGVAYMAASGYNPNAMASFLATMGDYSRLQAEMAGRNPDSVDQFDFMASHPRTTERVQRAIAEAAGESQEGSVLRRDVYLQNIDGLLFGDDPKEGIIRGREFIHPDLRFEFEAPQGFRLQNSPTRVVAGNGRDAGMIFDMAQSSSGLPKQYLEREWSNRIALSNIETFKIRNLPAAVGTTRVQSQNGITDLMVAAIKADGGRVYRFTFVTEGGRLGAYDGAFSDSVRSFRRLSKAQARAIKAYRIQIKTVRKKDSVAKLSKGMPFGGFNAKMFRILNDLIGNQEPTTGEEIKVVST